MLDPLTAREQHVGGERRREDPVGDDAGCRIEAGGGWGATWCFWSRPAAELWAGTEVCWRRLRKP